ncbi:DUF6907 domain-containing protein [Nocardia takedensis]
MTVDLSCPPWCEWHLDRDIDNPNSGIAHYGGEFALDIAEVVLIGVVRRISMRVSARDDGRSRRCVIEMVDPHGVGSELSTDEAQQLAQALIDAADLRTSNLDGECPSWCLEHIDPDPDDPDDEREHRGPCFAMVVAGTYEPTVTLEVGVRAFDEEYSCRMLLEVLVQSVSTELSAAEACKAAAQLLDCIDLATLAEAP